MRWRSPWLRLGLVIALGAGTAAGWASLRQYERSVRIENEIAVLRTEAERVARENETLSEKIQYFASPNFKEGEAKEKLGLRRQEEEMISVEGETRFSQKDSTDLTDTADIRTVAWETPNYLKWWSRFFNERPR